jgi:hypothetical protein
MRLADEMLPRVAFRDSQGHRRWLIPRKLVRAKMIYVRGPAT